MPGYEASAWYGIGAPQGTPDDIVDKVNAAINASLAEAKVQAQLADLGASPLPGSATAFGKLVADETDKWGKVIKFAGIKAE